MAEYKLLGNGVVTTDAGSTSIPPNPENRHYQEYQEWIAAGNKPDPEFTAAELKANTKAEAEAKARAAFAKRDFEERWLASPEKTALK